MEEKGSGGRDRKGREGRERKGRRVEGREERNRREGKILKEGKDIEGRERY